MRYRIALNNKDVVHVDEEGYKKLLENINSNFVILNDEVINPAYIVSITKVNEWLFANSSSATLSEEPKKIKGHIDHEKRTYVIDEVL